ncbi:hypothetical protein POM88_037708 [Heracleum sosnowskyi]|uniref:Uncharacterized protein n=1 Tax=Heracleum sosnowskyi TaxID=360622 RepID=A0AAD8HR00_9APIA|nr:hypothetical protein POM88_037708 [Heracleum sosnowskyi]
MESNTKKWKSTEELQSDTCYFRKQGKYVHDGVTKNKYVHDDQSFNNPLDYEYEVATTQLSITSLLASPERDYVITNKGEHVPIHKLEDKVQFSRIVGKRIIPLYQNYYDASQAINCFFYGHCDGLVAFDRDGTLVRIKQRLEIGKNVFPFNEFDDMENEFDDMEDEVLPLVEEFFSEQLRILVICHRHPFDDSNKKDNVLEPEAIPFEYISYSVLIYAKVVYVLKWSEDLNDSWSLRQSRYISVTF